MRRLLLALVNRRAVFTAAAVIFAAMGYLLARDGLVPLDFVIFTAVGVALYGIWRLLLTQATPQVDDVQIVRDTIRNGSTPTLIQFYSRHCLGCMAIKPVVDALEAEAGDRMKIIKLNIDDEPGKTLMKDYEVVFTPTFYFYDANGDEVMNSSFILDKPRILYTLEQLPV